MDSASFDQIFRWADRAGIITMLIVVVIAVIKGHWVPGYEYRGRVAERDKATELLAASVQTNTRLSEAVETLTDQLRRVTDGWRPPRP